MSVIRVALVNDYEVVVQGLSAILRSYRDQVQVVELDFNTSVGKPVDIALYDTFAGTHSHRDDPRLRLLVANPLVTKVVVYSWNVDDALVTAALANGAAGYLSKGLPARQLIAALHAVHHGDKPVRPSDHGSRAQTAGDWPGQEEGLTEREAEILALITQGLSNSQIAERAHLSINTVKSSIRSCYRRIGATNRSTAILWGIEHGFRPNRDQNPPMTPEQR